MGGHGALVCFLRNPGMYKAVSAFAPICNPIGCPWGQKAFSGYLGDNKETWKQYDACELVKQYKGPAFEILADQVLCESSLNHSCVLYCELWNHSWLPFNRNSQFIQLKGKYMYVVPHYVMAFFRRCIPLQERFRYLINPTVVDICGMVSLARVRMTAFYRKVSFCPTSWWLLVPKLKCLWSCACKR